MPHTTSRSNGAAAAESSYAVCMSAARDARCSSSQRPIRPAPKAPGFVAGYWTSDQAAGKAYAMILLDSEEAAHQLKAIVEGSAKGQSEVGISPEVLAVAKVMAHADSAARPVTQT